ncbi:hypothetical protein [Nitrosomonas mobilis]|uniref:PEP-CTERM protein-sorting domain-containing protein n=1 Tax=Nitrosomonas mobilis TaxID=51642 RepID=A0A1G5SCG4_9PROT|nr:hypothetical protein [Nitrosomonas mobilis]SCZ84885.1 conserved exported hypothetical protein [Nitrosomonas mobilis]
MINLRNAPKYFFSTVALSMLLFGFNPLATSAVLVNQPYLANSDGFLSSVNGGYENAESFVLPGAVNLTSIVWWGSDAGADDFLVRIGTSLGSWTNLAGSIAKTATFDIDNENRDIFRFEQTLDSALTLTADTHFLSISQEAEEWFWTVGSLGSGFGQLGSFFGDSQGWFPDETAELSFQLAGEGQSQSVPEPGMLALFLVGIFAFWEGRKRSG